jgi:hypothetical protein
MDHTDQKQGLTTPVCLIIFRRPKHTRQLLQALSVVQPGRLFVVADGPRVGHPDDEQACRETRDLIDQIDWPCDVIKNYSDVNLGCGQRPSSGISWLFEQVEEAIILEDDCIPDPTFFRFCEQLLSKYRNDPSVMQISGSTYHRQVLPISSSYFFSRAPGCWGWATWKRAWTHYDASVQAWPRVKSGDLLKKCLGSPDQSREYEKALDHAYATRGSCSHWDYQWGLACFLNSGLSIFPKYNLVCNVGFDEGATHTLDSASRVAYNPSQAMRFPLVHPGKVAANRKMERYYRRLNEPGIIGMIFHHRLVRRFRRLFNKIILNPEHQR